MIRVRQTMERKNAGFSSAQSLSTLRGYATWSTIVFVLILFAILGGGLYLHER